MSIQALQELRDFIRADAALQDFFLTQYGKDARYLIGYKSPNAANFPQLCFVPVTTRVGKGFGDQLSVSVIVGVQDAGFTDDQSDGVVHSLQIAQLIRNRVESGDIGAHTFYTGQMQIFTDKSAQHPFYEIELILPLTWR